MFSGTGLSGSFTDAGDGSASYRGAKFGSGDWDVFQQTVFMVNTGSWAGTSLQGAFNYDAEITAMTENQVAVGLFFSPLAFAIDEIAVLEIFDCSSGICAGNGVPMQNGPFADGVTAIVFSGTGSANISQVPLPSAFWLMQSGIAGLTALARCKIINIKKIPT